MRLSRLHNFFFVLLTLAALNVSAPAFGTEEELPADASEDVSADVPEEIIVDVSEEIPSDDAQEVAADLPEDFPPGAIFDDKMLLEGYTEKYLEEEKDILLARIKDDTLPPYQMAAAVRAFKEKYSLEVFNREKNIIIKILLRRLARTDNVFVQVEILHTVCRMDRYKYFATMMPALIQKLDHYNATVNEMAYDGINDIIDRGNNRAREARIVFNTLRKVLSSAAGAWPRSTNRMNGCVRNSTLSAGR